MKIRASIRKICEKCQLIRRWKRIIVKNNIYFNMKWIYPYISDLYL